MLEIRNLERTDLKYIFDILQNDELIMQIDGNKPTDLSSYQKRYESYFEGRSLDIYLNTLLVDDEVIGSIDFHHNTSDNYIEFGMYIKKEFQKMGYGKEALTWLFDKGFGELECHSIRCEVYTYNTVSNKFMLSNGMLFEGTKRDVDYRDSEYRSLNQYSILKSEYIKIDSLI